MDQSYASAQESASEVTRLKDLNSQLQSLLEAARAGAESDSALELQRLQQSHTEEMAARLQELQEAHGKLQQLEGAEQKVADLQVS